MIKVFIKVATGLIVSLPLFSQVTITPTLVSLQNGNALYCAAKWIKPQIQVYCYTTATKALDTLSFNSIFTVGSNNAYVVDTHQNYNKSTGRNTVSFIFNNDGATLKWQATINGLALQTGTFQ